MKIAYKEINQKRKEKKSDLKKMMLKQIANLKQSLKDN